MNMDVIPAAPTPSEFNVILFRCRNLLSYIFGRKSKSFTFGKKLKFPRSQRPHFSFSISASYYYNFSILHFSWKQIYFNEASLYREQTEFMLHQRKLFSQLNRFLKAKTCGRQSWIDWLMSDYYKSYHQPCNSFHFQFLSEIVAPPISDE